MTGDHGIGAAATWRRDATTIKATVMQNDHSRAADGQRRDRYTDFFAEPDVL
jgi:predicted ester cyclase